MISELDGLFLRIERFFGFSFAFFFWFLVETGAEDQRRAGNGAADVAQRFGRAAGAPGRGRHRRRRHGRAQPAARAALLRIPRRNDARGRRQVRRRLPTVQ